MLLLTMPIHLLLRAWDMLLPLTPPPALLLEASKIPGWCGSSLQSSVGRWNQPSATDPPQYVPDWAQCSAATHTEL